MFYVLHFDCDAELLRVVYLVKVAFEILKLVIPILLIIMCMLDIIKSIMGKEGWDKKVTKKIVSKILAAVLVYLVPTFINLGLSALGEANFTLGTCWKEATSENVNTTLDIPDTTIGELEDADEKIAKALKLRRDLEEKWEKE